jgi:hypothetical protein
MIKPGPTAFALKCPHLDNGNRSNDTKSTSSEGMR